jgi:ribosomal protein S18 acetylase RimI-like enzyme
MDIGGSSLEDCVPIPAMALTSKPLSTRTWRAFAQLVEKHNGIFGGCWCISFHLVPGEGKHSGREYRAMKAALVQEGRAHAALVFDGLEAVGWCQFGRSAELPNIRSAKAYDAGAQHLPDWRITCFFIDRARRGEGIASLALREALHEIGRLGGGVVEAYPEDYTGRRVSCSFLCSGTLGMFEKAGFERTRKIAMHRWVVVRTLPAGAQAPPRRELRHARTAPRPDRAELLPRSR